MKTMLINLIDDINLRSANMKLVDEEIMKLGENKLIELFLILITENTELSISRVLGLAQMVNATMAIDKLVIPKNNRLQWVSWAEFLFAPLAQFKIPIKYWIVEARIACELISKFIRSNYESIDKMPEFEAYYSIRSSAEKRLAQDPRFKINFEKYSSDMGST